MQCNQAQKLMREAQEGHIPASDRKRLDTHLTTCEGCRTMFESCSDTGDMLSEALPLHITLGDDFAGMVMEKLPERRTGLRALKEAIIMSRFKYAAIGMAVAVLMIYCFFSSRSFDAKAFAAIQDAMSRARSVHYVVKITDPRFSTSGFEAWSTPKATKYSQGRVWSIFREGSVYTYYPSDKTIYVMPAGDWTPAGIFQTLMDPKSITHTGIVKKSIINTKNVIHHGNPMIRVEILSTLKVSKDDLEAIQKMRAYMHHRHYSGGSNNLPHVNLTALLKTVYFVDPTTKLVRGMEQYVYMSPKSGWRLIGRTVLVEYDINTRSDFFDIPTASHTKDLRNDPAFRDMKERL